MSDDIIILADHKGRAIRLTDERLEHILEHSEMADQLERIKETIKSPSTIVATSADETVYVYHRFYEITPVTSKFLLVAVKLLEDDAFVLTAFFSGREKKGDCDMDTLKVWYDRDGDMLEVIFEDAPSTLEEIYDDVFERRTPDGRVIGFMVMNFSKHDREKLNLPLAVMVKAG